MFLPFPWILSIIIDSLKKLKFATGRSYDDLKLSNKGKMKKAKAEFHHKKDGPSGKTDFTYKKFLLRMKKILM